MSTVRGGKAEKTNWVMHQYHLGTEEDEKDGEYVISKLFYQQQQQVKQGEKMDQDFPEVTDTGIGRVVPVTPMSVTPEPPRSERRRSDFDLGQNMTVTCAVSVVQVGPLSLSISLSRFPICIEHAFSFCYEIMLFHNHRI